MTKFDNKGSALILTQMTATGLLKVAHTHTHTHTLLNGGGVDPIKLLGLPKIQLHVGHHEVVRNYCKLHVLL